MTPLARGCAGCTSATVATSIDLQASKGQLLEDAIAAAPATESMLAICQALSQHASHMDARLAELRERAQKHEANTAVRELSLRRRLEASHQREAALEVNARAQTSTV